MKKQTNPKLKPLLVLVSMFILFAVSTLAALTLTSCDKEDPDPQNATTFPVPSYPETPEDADAVLIAIKASTPFAMQTPIEIPGMPGGSSEITMEYGMGVALFKGNAQAGSVKLNNTTLKFSNGVYMWQPDFTDLTNPSSITGVDLSGNISWEVTSPNIEKTLTGLPGMPKVTSGKVMTKIDGYTLTNVSVSGANKILYGVYSSNGKYVLKEKAGNSTSITFSKEELAELGNTKNGIIQANAYVITNETIGGKKVYFIRQSSYSLTNVEIK
ncbi:hypothetical protein G5B30_10830 [Sphingobacterium sp. SGG-5]|uniref:hypothetical protein n=1 Tax=Sphingobacterium sp. SGG-5 TaxID=2710881 RepID=UPI0013EACEA1|nr:hypothetical protein [Sphingobacterium sp. SGG-5]NGM62407.1 hypothetical protein [Sphingobacterium sp. SGG-5]